jgi:hypothetical protein
MTPIDSRGKLPPSQLRERRWHFDVIHEGRSVPLEIRAFMDDVEAPDMYFFTVPTLAEVIQAEIIRFAEEHGRQQFDKAAQHHVAAAKPRMKVFRIRNISDRVACG